MFAHTTYVFFFSPYTWHVFCLLECAMHAFSNHMQRILTLQYVRSIYNSCCFFYLSEVWFDQFILSPPPPLSKVCFLSYNMQAKVFSFRYDIVCFIHMLFFCQIILLAIQITGGHKASPMLMLVIFNLNVALNICSCNDTVDRSHND